MLRVSKYESSRVKPKYFILSGQQEVHGEHLWDITIFFIIKFSNSSVVIASLNLVYRVTVYGVYGNWLRQVSLKQWAGS